MGLFKFQGVKFTPRYPVPDFSEDEFAEWFMYEIGLSQGIKSNNPLVGTRLKESEFKAEKVFWNGDDITDLLPNLTA